MTLQDYARIRALLLLLAPPAPGEAPLSDADAAAAIAELQQLQAMIGVQVSITEQAQYDAIAAKLPAVTQEELDGMRTWENAHAVADIIAMRANAQS
ncbi:MAG TPA: hypothetical protein VMH83_06235 [Candidatus Acidoferrum sp.]|nr:hypothetical protein [Candidatus Acidoferrum sp.]